MMELKRYRRRVCMIEYYKISVKRHTFDIKIRNIIRKGKDWI